MYENYPQVKTVYWTKNGNRLVNKEGGGRYSDVSVEKPSLTISDVNEYDAGSYQLTATNNVGSTASDFIILGIEVEKKNCWMNANFVFFLKIFKFSKNCVLFLSQSFDLCWQCIAI